MTAKFRGDGGVACSGCGKIRYPQPERGIFKVGERCVDCYRTAQADRGAAKLAESERAKADARARQGTLPGFDGAPTGLHGADRGGRR